jgi:hypothetical protein
MAVQAPIDKLTHQVLRAAVLHLKESESRRRFPVSIHVGFPGHSRSWTCLDGLLPDHGMRCDLALALLQPDRDGAPTPYAWLTRPGSLSIHDVDLPWSSAFSWAAEACGVAANLVVVTRVGWFDPVSGVSREWRRLRRHCPDPVWPH